LTPAISRRLVIDIDVVAAAGQKIGLNSDAKACRDFIDAVLKICHHIAVCATWSEEWLRHRNSYASTWLRRMHGPKKVNEIENIGNKTLRKNIERSITHPEILEIIMKDLFLCETALRTDKIIISCDEKSRNHFREAARSVVELRDIVWINPTNSDEEVLIWLQNGAPFEKFRTLGSSL
jgi:hypothetical protein